MQAMVHPVKSEEGTDTLTLGDRSPTTDAHFLCQLAQLQAEAHVLARANADAYELLCGGASVPTLGKSTPLRALCGFLEACFRRLCKERSKEISIALGWNASSTWFDRCVFNKTPLKALYTNPIIWWSQPLNCKSLNSEKVSHNPPRTTLLWFLASTWRAGREGHKRTHGRFQIQGHTLNGVKGSFNRFCTFGVTATGVLH